MLSTLLTSIFTGEAALAVKRTRAAVIAYALMGVCALIAAIFLLTAAFIYVSRFYGTLETALGFGAGFLVLAIIVWVVHTLRMRVRAKRRAQRHRGELASLAGAAALAALPTLVKGRSAVSLVALPLFGLIAAQIYRENTRRTGPVNDSDNVDEG